MDGTRFTARMEGDFCVFLIGMRINKIWKVNHWLPVVRAMGKMLNELYKNPQLGFISSESGFGRTIIMVQYWKSADALIDYATNKTAAHLPAWKEFNQKTSKTGDVGIWHETYIVRNGDYETIYANMPPFGLGKAGQLTQVGPGTKTSRQRIEGLDIHN